MLLISLSPNPLNLRKKADKADIYNNDKAMIVEVN